MYIDCLRDPNSDLKLVLSVQFIATCNQVGNDDIE